jgi:hypothetical protein
VALIKLEFLFLHTITSHVVQIILEVLFDRRWQRHIPPKQRENHWLFGSDHARGLIFAPND